ncbi:MAG TPA: hypothetical protein VH682_10650 [Gemmataceae bacterium]
MTTPQTTSAADNIGTNGVNGAFPADVITFAAANQVEDCLQPLLEATHRIFPTARFVKVQIDDDPEIRDLRHILYNVQVAGLSLDQSRAADNQWTEELLRICSPVRACVFRLRMDLKR